MKKFAIILCIVAFIAACGGGKTESAAPASDNKPTESTASEAAPTNSENPSYDPKRGEGKFTNVEVADQLDAAMASAGQKVYEVKCSSCHKLTDERLVGPGWQGVTDRHTPEWIMNFATNTEAMLDKDPKAQAQLEICLVRMPNQNIADEDARSLYEFMRKNDGVK